MAPRLAVDLNRSSIGSLEDDQFYSAPSSRINSRHVSLVAAPTEVTSTTRPPESLVSVLRFDPTPTAPPPTPQTPSIRHTLKSRWATPFASIQHQHNPKHHHLCSTYLSRRFHKADHALPKTAPRLTASKNSKHEFDRLVTERLISSPAYPVTTRRWSSVHASNQPVMSPSSTRSYSLIDSRLDGQTGMDRQAIDGIVCNIRAYLSDKRHDQCSPRLAMSLTANENRPPSSGLQVDENTTQSRHVRENEPLTDSYLVTTGDIAGILEIVIAGLRHVDDQNSLTACLSLLLPKESLAKPTPNVKAIIPIRPSIADPATTISSVQPSFSLTRCSGQHKHYLDATRATIISRQSITESPTASRKVSTNGLSPTEEEPTVLPRQFLTRRSSSAPASSRQSYTKSGRSSSTRRDSSMTNFPKLASRANTTDWLTPLGLYGEPDQPRRRETISNLYNHGVDAHCGANTSTHLPILEESPLQTPLPLEFDSLFQDAERAWSFQLDEAPRAPGKRMGRKIRDAAHQRKSSVRPIDIRKPDPYDSLLDKLRRYSLMPLLDQTPESIRAASPPAQTWTAFPLRVEGRSKRSSKAMLQDILDRAPVSTRSSRSSSGRWRSRSSVSQKTPKRHSRPGRISCSEETAPHLCMDEQMSPWSEREIDWVA
ncbi:hypothetical protein F4779DRAFT_637011 [Xylariaceae sp. FL0662B]|nr:hypothetical protein F4779DRAFT_637011 [Xylariaceae sp. FL0662B]